MIQSSDEGVLAAGVDLAPARTYAERLADGVLAYQRCGSCDAAVFYPRVACPVCGGTDLSWQVSAGQGTVYSTTTIPQRDADPYNVCLVDLDEGFRMMSTVVGVPSGQVRIGQRVQGRVETEGSEPRPVFELVEAAQ
jgi:uncharacterized OB-fold protein